MDRADALARRRAEMIRRGACAAILLAIPWDVSAGRPLSVEDASVVEEHGCQVEAWVDRSSEATVGWIVPACNFFWNTEWQAGFARSHEGETRFSDAYFQGKTLWREVSEQSSWGFATVFGLTRKPLNERHRGYDNPYALAVWTLSVGEAPVLVHANVGSLRDRETSRHATAWGFAAEAPVNAAWAVMGEVFGENTDRTYWRVGARWTAVPRHLDFDLSLVSRTGGGSAERFISLGVTWQTGRLVP